MASIELGLISSAWNDTAVGTEEGIRLTKEIGFDTYDIFDDPLDIDDAQRKLIKDTCEEVGLPIRSAPCVAFSLVDFNPSVQRFTRDRIRAYIDQGKYFGARNICVVMGEYYWDGEVFPKEAIWDICKENMTALADDADKAGLDLVIELEPFSEALVGTVGELARFIREVDHPRVKANADISHLHLSGASFDDVKVLTGMVGHFHVSDCDGKVHGDLPPGRGVTPIKEYVQAVLDTGVESSTMSIELEYSPDPDKIVDWVTEAYTSTAKILDELGVRAA